MKKFLLTICTSSLFAAIPQMPMSMPPFEGGEPKISVQNSIVTQINGTTLSIMDVKKKLDVAFHQAYPQLIDSTNARFQFYQTGWKNACMELIDHELILADAEEREIKVTEGEVREEMENRFGPNVMVTLDKVGISYADAWKLVRNDMIVQRMMWYFVQSKALQSVTPQDLRQEYRRYIKENPPYQDWTYQVIAIRTDDPAAISTLADTVFTALQEQKEKPDDLKELLKGIEKQHGACSINVSNEYTANHLKLADSHRLALEPLSSGEYSKPTLQTSRNGKETIARIFYLAGKQDFPAPSFEDMAQKIKNELLQHAIVSESERYLGKLRKRHGYDAMPLQEAIPDSLTPFSLQ